MKTIVINADPKDNEHNAKLMKSSLEGAKSVGAETKYVNLYDLNLSGCRVCSMCKKDEEVCKCFWNDDLSPLIEEIFNSDALLIGVPIFFSQPSSHYLALLERLIYSLVSYKTGNKFNGKVNVGLFYTINFPLGYFEKSVLPHLKQSEDLLKMLHGDVVIFTSRKISATMRNNSSDDELKLMKEQIASDIKKAFEIGAELSS
ncbi:flavodoxin family protein [Methanobrevibacter sp.]|uniref:flavodoxin family protein n=1 Tax=Methanobrevibacter sp. TaxID=66852 RepID=UPI00388D8EC9